MNFTESISSCFSNYITFSGRSSRSEFWWFSLFIFVVSIIAAVADGAMFNPLRHGGSAQVFSSLWSLIVVLPFISVAVRRLHDIGRTGWWYWIAAIPLIGSIVLLVFFLSRSEEGPNAYGPVQRAPTDLGLG